MEHELIAKSLRCCADYSENFTCSNCGYYGNGCRMKMLPGAATAIEELMAQVKDKDYLIQQQADEIERLRRDVKKQQEKMIELAKGLPKNGEYIKVADHVYRCSLCNDHRRYPSNYCPKCGAKMMEVQDDKA